MQDLPYPRPNLSHLHSVGIQDTASRSDQYLREGWLMRAFAVRLVLPSFGTDGVIVDTANPGPLGGGTRAVMLASPDVFLNEVKLAVSSYAMGNAALAHMLKVEADIAKVVDGLRPRSDKFTFQIRFPDGGLGNSVETAVQVVTAPGRGGTDVAMACLLLGSPGAHTNQQGTQVNLLRQLGEGITSLKSASAELGRWNDTLIIMYSEFDRRPRENPNNGASHGTAVAHLAAGGRVKDGLARQGPVLGRLGDDGNLDSSVDFHSFHTTVPERWWGVDSQPMLTGWFAPLDLIKV